jgi:hypothetical protein
MWPDNENIRDDNGGLHEKPGEINLYYTCTLITTMG